MIVLLSGPVGAGKSTIAKELVAGASGPTVLIEGDVFWSFVAKNPPGATRATAFKAIMRAMLASAMAFSRDHYDTIVDFSMPPWYVEPALAKLGPRLADTDVRYVIVRPSLDVCAARAKSRAAGAIADYAHLREFYDTFVAAPDAITIADDHATPAEIAVRIREHLAAGGYKIAPNPNDK